MQKKYTKKIIGSLAIAIFTISLSLVGFTYAEAQYIDNNKTSVFDGLVTAKGADSLTLKTAGSNAIVVNVNKSTVYTKNMDFSDIQVNDSINVIARTNNGLSLAKVIKINHGTGYGCHDKIVQIHKAEVVSKSIADQTITVKSKLAIINIQITSSTKFFKTTFSDLKAGDKVNIKGTDSGTAFLTEHVILMK